MCLYKCLLGGVVSRLRASQDRIGVGDSTAPKMPNKPVKSIFVTCLCPDYLLCRFCVLHVFPTVTN